MKQTVAVMKHYYNLIFFRSVFVKQSNNDYLFSCVFISLRKNSEIHYSVLMMSTKLFDFLNRISTHRDRGSVLNDMLCARNKFIYLKL